MIISSKDLWGLQDVFRLYGSAWPRSIVMASFCTLLTLVLEVGSRQSTTQGWWSGAFGKGRNPTPLPFQLFAFIVGFGLVFRSTFAYRRYWEGRTFLQAMTASFTEMVVQTLNFERGTLPKNATSKQLHEANVFGETFVHLMSLLHGIAVANLREDWDLRNMKMHDGTVDPPPYDALELIRKKSQRKYTLEAQKNQARRFLGISKRSKDYYRSQVFKGKFRFRDFFLLRSKPSIRLAYNELMPIFVIGDVGEEERLALGSQFDDEVRISSEVSKGYRLSTGYMIPGPGERVNVVASWVNQIIIERRKKGGLAVPPPIMTRVYGVLSGGLSAYEQCRKLSDTPFPFPAAQLVTGVLLMFMLGLPFVVAASIKTLWLALLITFISSMTHYGLNELARDLEDPFIYDPNDLPLARIQYNFNERILAIARTKRPGAHTETALARVPTMTRSALFQTHQPMTLESILEQQENSGDDPPENQGTSGT